MWTSRSLTGFAGNPSWRTTERTACQARQQGCSALLHPMAHTPHTCWAWLRIQLRAVWADSCITSPSCPVSFTKPLPAMVVASMYSSCPPVGVHAKPVTTPGMSACNTSQDTQVSSISMNSQQTESVTRSLALSPRTTHTAHSVPLVVALVQTWLVRVLG